MVKVNDFLKNRQFMFFLILAVLIILTAVFCSDHNGRRRSIGGQYGKCSAGSL